MPVVMDFNEKQVIYLQIAEYVNDHILLGEWKADEKIPSVRDVAATLQVNPNTAMRAYDFLQQKGILYNRRGLGNYVAAEAVSRIFTYRREQFLTVDLPPVFRSIFMLDLSFDELKQLYDTYVKENFPEK